MYVYLFVCICMYAHLCMCVCMYIHIHNILCTYHSYAYVYLLCLHTACIYTCSVWICFLFSFTHVFFLCLRMPSPHLQTYNFIEMVHGCMHVTYMHYVHACMSLSCLSAFLHVLSDFECTLYIYIYIDRYIHA